ncbi:MAG: gliding motility lipoprotein GldH [Bacteroidaceae bacterium]
MRQSRRTITNKWFAILLATLLLTACHSNTVHHSFQSINKDGWSKSDTLSFSVILPDSTSMYKVKIEIRNDYNYPYRNLYLFVSNNLSNIAHFTTDTIEYKLANNNGKWIGTGWGTVYQSSYSIPYILSTPQGGHTFKINHGMTDDLLQGISNVGICIEK